MSKKYSKLSVCFFILSLTCLIMPNSTTAESILDNFLTNYQYRSFGITDITKCTWHVTGWLFAASCNEVEAYDINFFMLNGYASSPKAG